MEHDETNQLFETLTTDLQTQYNTDHSSVRVKPLGDAVEYARDLYCAAIAKSGALEVIDPEEVATLQYAIVSATAKELIAKHPDLEKGKPIYVDSNGEEDGAGTFIVIMKSDIPDSHLASPQKLLRDEAIVGNIDTYGIIPLPTPQDELSSTGQGSNQWGLVILLRDVHLHSGDNRIPFDGQTIAIPLQDERLSIGKPIDQLEDVVHDRVPVQDVTYAMRDALRSAYNNIENQLNYEEHDEDPDARRAHANARREAIEQLRLMLDSLGITQDSRLRIKATAQGAGDRSTEVYSLDGAEVLFDSPNIIKFVYSGWRALYEFSLVQVDGQHQPIYVFPEMIESVIRLTNQIARSDENE